MIEQNQNLKKKKQRNNFNDELIKDSFCNSNNYNFGFKNYNSKYNKNCKNNIYYQIKENNFEKYKNYKKYNKIKHSKVIYY